MKPEDQHIALMESLGWTEVALNFPRKTHKDFIKKLEKPPFPVGVPPGKKSGWRARLPELTLDLMLEAEKIIYQGERDFRGRYGDYCQYLNIITSRDFAAKTHWSMHPLHATAAQRLEAYLKTKGLWKES